MKNNGYSDLPYFLKAGDAVFFQENFPLSLSETAKLMPAGTSILVFSEEGWNVFYIPLKQDEINTLKPKTVHSDAFDDDLLNRISEHEIKRICTFKETPSAVRAQLGEFGSVHGIEMVVYENVWNVTEDDFITGEENEEFEKRLKDLGYM